MVNCITATAQLITRFWDIVLCLKMQCILPYFTLKLILRHSVYDYTDAVSKFRNACRTLFTNLIKQKCKELKEVCQKIFTTSLDTFLSPPLRKITFFCFYLITPHALREATDKVRRLDIIVDRHFCVNAVARVSAYQNLLDSLLMVRPVPKSNFS